MAKSSNRGGGEGTSDRGGVRTTMTPAFGAGKGTNKGSQGAMRPPFNAPRQGGSELPTKLYETDMPARKASATSRDELGTIWTDPNGPRR